MALLGNILYDTIYHSAPIILCVIGGMFAYKANVLNIALEGMMLNGAFVATLLVFFTDNIPLSIFLAIVTTLIYGLIFSLLGITYKGNVIIVGLAINLIVPAIAGFILQIMGTANINLTNINIADFKINIPIIQDIPLIGNILSGHTPITYLSFIGIIVLTIIMYKTKFGIYVRVVGENEDAAKSLGIKTNVYKYAAVLIGAFCCALAGVNFSLERLGLFTNDMTAGRGFIAIAAIYCGQGKPVASSMYAILFGVARALAVNLSIYAGPIAGLFDTIPYIIMVTVLAVVSAVKYKNVKVRGFKAE
ncbi:ABC transporter permease [Clostridium botulinum]|uniref:ABC transporter permease n=1 Tax=Clostridium botulinum TaxID=1491 RepID=A0A0C2N577_CLOBO|nr:MULTISPECIES: ABC transporter permease [Clostridium]ACD53006.1 inner-membrane translocator [Clostridium botulinum E3 str. Alaska E43]AJF31027.1 ABC transporter permease [Clostridium botulinum]AJF34089.1 ABC transporter permease [Clostridium botulinum]KAI3350167.1 ABC transporter permease [Clostridium botulinum]KIL08245.1 ABC transporter permease [Clostridium botulinum]